MTDTGTEDPLAALGLTRDDLVGDMLAERAARGTSDKRVCACGHGMNRHDVVEVHGEEREVCNPTGSLCPCRKHKPVIEVSDTRPFLRKTLGTGRQHALLRGLAGLLEKEGRSFSWIDGTPECEMPGWEAAECEGPVSLVGVTDNGRVSDKPAPWNFLLCQAHTMAAQQDGLPS